MAIYGQTVLGFADGRKMRFFPHVDLVKSDQARGALEKAYEHQKFFTKAVIQDYTSDFLYIDLVPKDSTLLMIRKILLSIKSSIFSFMLLFHSINHT